MVRVNLPPFTRGLLVCLLGLSLVYQAAAHAYHTRVIPWLVVSPVRSVLYPWVYVTAALAEANVLTLLIAGATFFYGGRYLERAWGSRDFGAFLLVAALVPNLVVAALYVLAFAVTRGGSQQYFPFPHLPPFSHALRVRRR